MNGTQLIKYIVDTTAKLRGLDDNQKTVLKNTIKYLDYDNLKHIADALKYKQQ